MIILTAALLVFAALPAAAGERSRCSISPIRVLPDTASTYLLGTALPDTLLAGPGTLKPYPGSPAWESGEGRTIYGQVLQVERFAGADSATLAEVLAQRGTDRVVVVPWSYGSQCERLAWSQTAQWVPLGEPGMFRRLRLRPENDWAAGLPTFDAFWAWHEPYPTGEWFQRGFQGTHALRTQPSLTAAEYFDLYRALPDWHFIHSHPEAAAAGIARLEQQNPELLTKYPTAEVLQFVRVLIRMRQQ